MQLPKEKIDGVVTRMETIDQRLSQPIDRDSLVKLNRERAELDPVYRAILDLRSLETERADLDTLISDPEMAALAEEEVARLDAQIVAQTAAVRKLLIPKDAADEKSAILEIRAGTGGSEAALFAGDLFRMYQRYAQLHGWKVEIESVSEGEVGGFKEIIASIGGEGVFGRLKFESGVHRVQRVPDTEAQGRIHTSAATVAVLPEAEDVEIEINDA